MSPLISTDADIMMEGVLTVNKDFRDGGGLALAPAMEEVGAQFGHDAPALLPFSDRK